MNQIRISIFGGKYSNIRSYTDMYEGFLYIMTIFRFDTHQPEGISCQIIVAVHEGVIKVISRDIE